MIKLMLVDDHDLVRTGIKRLIEDMEGFSVVAEADCGETGLEKLESENPDVVLMDINMPGIGGLEATRRMLQIKPEIKVIIISMHDDELFPQRLLKAGALGYLTKGAKAAEIAKAVHTVIKNRRYLSPEVAQQLALSNLEDDAASPFESLSEREMQVLLMMMDGKNINSISESLFLSPKTVSTYRSRLYTKLDVSNDIELARLALLHDITDK
jgi:two-component system invasion response regulator UvrY